MLDTIHPGNGGARLQHGPFLGLAGSDSRSVCQPIQIDGLLPLTVEAAGVNPTQERTSGHQIASDLPQDALAATGCGGLTQSPAVGRTHQSLLAPADNKFHVGNGDDGKHYWLTPPALYAELDAEFGFNFDPCPHPLPDGFDGLTCEWGTSNYVNPPFGSIIHQGKKKGPTAWVRKSIEEWQKGKRVVLVYPVDKWVLMLLKAILGEHAQVRNLGDVRWLATEDGSQGKGTGRHIACFILEPVSHG